MAKTGRFVASRRILVRVDAGLHELLEVESIYYLRAVGDATELRTPRRAVYRSSEALAELETRLPPSFVRIHRSLVVNLDHVRQVRRRAGGDWQLKLDPPVNELLPLGRTRERAFFRRAGRA